MYRHVAYIAGGLVTAVSFTLALNGRQNICFRQMKYQVSRQADRYFDL
ncbi:MAG: hypothetical protein HY767_02110 [Candidatus Omnitrophica bacterium]|nr:hypothetical protein [Candidatus Omnitrophota bacterium]